VVIAEKKVFIPFLRWQVKSLGSQCDILITQLPKYYKLILSDTYDHLATKTVRQVVDLSGTWEEVCLRFSRRRRDQVRELIRKGNLTYKVSKEIQDFDFFYHQMHAPFVVRRFGKLAHVDSYSQMKEYFLRGMVILITRDDTPVAAALSHIEGNTLVYRRVGIADGMHEQDRYSQIGQYYYQMEYAHSLGLKAFDAMHSAAFMSDGVFENKRKWGASVQLDDEATEWIMYFNCDPSVPVAQFFHNHPLVSVGANGPEAILGNPTPGATESDCKNIVENNKVRGITRYTVISTDSKYMFDT
jgi:hypothetical protein